MWWLRLVLPKLRSAAELAVALYLYRLRIVRRSRTVSLSNERLLADLGVNRFTKYRALQKLADAGVIEIRRRDGRAIIVTLTSKKRGGRT